MPQKEIRKIIAKATAKKQKDRYQSAAEFRVAVEQISKISMPSATEQEKFGNIIETVQAFCDATAFPELHEWPPQMVHVPQ